MDALPIIVLGAGGHAKVLIDALLLGGATVLGVAAPESGRQVIAGLPVLGGDEVVASYAARAVRLVNGVGSVALPARRREIYERFKSQGYVFQSVIHPSAVIARDVELGEGTQVMAGAVIQVGSRIGANAIINTRASVDHDCRIGAHVHVAPGVTLCGGVCIEEGAHLGSGSTVVQGVSIGSGCLVGAGSVVIHDVPSGAAVAGVPAREIKK